MTLSYHNDPSVKARHVAMAKHHYEADMLLSGTYGNTTNGTFRGCSVGCMAHDIAPGEVGNLHKIVADDAGLPEWLMHLSDSMFEGLPKGERERFHVELREAIPVGVDLEPVRHRLAILRMDRLADAQRKALGKHGDEIDSAINDAIRAIAMVRRCHEAEIGGNACDWSAARSAARSAYSAYSAADSADSARSSRSAARSAALSAADSAYSAALSARSARSARSAADSADSAYSADSAADSAARSAMWKQEASDLLRLLREVA